MQNNTIVIVYSAKSDKYIYIYIAIQFLISLARDCLFKVLFTEYFKIEHYFKSDSISCSPVKGFSLKTLFIVHLNLLVSKIVSN